MGFHQQCVDGNIEYFNILIASGKLLPMLGGNIVLQTMFQYSYSTEDTCRAIITIRYPFHGNGRWECCEK